MRIEEMEDNMLELKSFDVKDELTGMYNKEMFEFDLERKLMRAVDKKSAFALFCMDLDRLEQYKLRNDAYDAELAVFTSGVFIKEFVKEMKDKAYRIGDDEFAVIVVGKHDYDMEIMAECLVDGIAELNICFKDKKLEDLEKVLVREQVQEQGKGQDQDQQQQQQQQTSPVEYLTASVGATWCREADSSITPKQLLENAMDALKRAKALGGNRAIITEI